MVLRHFSLPWGPLQGLPIWGATGAATGLAPQRACLLGWLGARLAPGLAWLAWVAGFGFDLAWLGIWIWFDLASGFNLLGFWLDLI